MGGAERAQRRRRQQQAAAKGGTPPKGAPAAKGSPAGQGGKAAKPEPSAKGAKGAGGQKGAGHKGGGAVRAARASTGTGVGVGVDRSRLLTGLVVVAVIAAVVVGGVLWQRSRSAPPDAAPVKTVDAQYPVTVDDGVVVAGEETAELTVEIYEDFLCPACGAFEEANAAKVEQALESGAVKVRYHLLNLLDQQSNPPGYSLDSAAAGVCAAEAGEFPSFHASLFAAQPREGGRGYSVDQLVQLGRDVGISGPEFESCVRGGTHADAVRAQLDRARNDQALRRPHPNGGNYFGTPTVVADGKLVDTGNENWLQEAMGGAG